MGYNGYNNTDSTMLINAPEFEQPGNEMERMHPMYRHTFAVFVLAAACIRTPMKDAFNHNWNPIYEIAPTGLVNLQTKVCFPYFCN